MPDKGQAWLTVVGLGNLGSQVVPLIAYLPGLRGVTLVDKDRYSAANLISQRINRSDAGKPKALVQTRLLRAMNPALDIQAWVDDVANVPMGALRCGLLIACLDSLEGRITINQIAWRMGLRWLDGGVDPQGRFVRVEAYAPGPENNCFECALTAADYATLGSRFPCQLPGPPTAATAGPRSLGALGAALLAEECAKILEGRVDTALVGRQIIVGTSPHTQMITVLRRNPRCRFAHETWKIKPFQALTPAITVGEALKVLSAEMGEAAALAVGGKSFALRLRCAGCGAQREGLHVLGRLRPAASACHRCRRPMLVSALELLPQLDQSLPGKLLRMTLGQLGIREQDVLQVSGAQGRGLFCELGGRNGSDCDKHKMRTPTAAKHQSL